MCSTLSPRVLLVSTSCVVGGCGLIVVRIVVAAVVCSLLVVAPARVVWVVV